MLGVAENGNKRKFTRKNARPRFFLVARRLIIRSRFLLLLHGLVSRLRFDLVALQHLCNTCRLGREASTRSWCETLRFVPTFRVGGLLVTAFSAYKLGQIVWKRRRGRQRAPTYGYLPFVQVRTLVVKARCRNKPFIAAWLRRMHISRLGSPWCSPRPSRGGAPASRNSYV